MSRPSRAPSNVALRSDYSRPNFTPSTGHYSVYYGTSPTRQSAALNTSAAPLASADRYATVKRLSAEYKGIFTESALRNLIWHAEAHARNPKPGSRSNGFLDVIHRPGGTRKVLLDRVAFANWIANGKNAEVFNG